MYVKIIDFNSMTTTAFLIVAGLLAGSPAYSQTHPFLGKFTATEVNGTVQLGWTILAGNTCNGIQIYRSLDSLNFSLIGAIGGVCGSLSSPTQYTFTDNAPAINRRNYYRLELGGNGASQIISIEIIRLSSDGTQIRPHPASSHATIYFDNSIREQHKLILYTTSGMLIHRANSDDNFFSLEVENFPSGIYIFAIFTPDKLLTARGKLLVQR